MIGAAAMRLSDFAALTFDCYGTLIDWEAGILAALRPWAARHGVTATDAALLEAFAGAESRREAESPDALYPEILAAALGDIAAQLGVDAAPGEARAFGASVKDWPAFPDSPDALAYLKRHYKLVIVSNIDRESFRRSNVRLGVEFDHVVTAQDVESYKPALGHFDAALAWLARAGVSKDRVLHVAQSLYHDHVPAKRLGLKTVWVNRRAGAGWGATMPPPAAVTPDWEVPTLAALAELHRKEAGG